MIHFSNIAKSFDNGNTWLLRNINFEVHAGETLVLLGGSGSGKSTLLKMVNRLILPEQGEIILNGQNILQHDPITLRRSIGYVFQGVGLFPHLTVAENIAIVPRLFGVPTQQRQQRAYELLALVKLDPHHYAERFPAQLSGGQQQRVGVARALANDPNCLLMDEPFAALDPITRDELQAEVMGLKSLGKTILFVTHDITEALRLGDRIAILYKGGLEQIGQPGEILAHPASDFVRQLFALQDTFVGGKN